MDSMTRESMVSGGIGHGGGARCRRRPKVFIRNNTTGSAAGNTANERLAVVQKRAGVPAVEPCQSRLV
jgi:hypothetical protein